MNPRRSRHFAYPNNVVLSPAIPPKQSRRGSAFASSKWPRIFGPAVTPILMAVAASPDSSSAEFFPILGATKAQTARISLRAAVRLGLILNVKRRYRINTALVDHDDFVAFLRAMASAHGMQLQPQLPKTTVENPTPMPKKLFEGERKRKALCAIAMLGEAYNRELAETLNIRASLAYTLRRLVGEGTLARRSIGTAVAYSLNPELPGVESLRAVLIGMGTADPTIRSVTTLVKMRRTDVVEYGMCDVYPMIARLAEPPEGKTKPT